MWNMFAPNLSLKLSSLGLENIPLRPYPDDGTLIDFDLTYGLAGEIMYLKVSRLDYNLDLPPYLVIYFTALRQHLNGDLHMHRDPFQKIAKSGTPPQGTELATPDGPMLKLLECARYFSAGPSKPMNQSDREAEHLRQWKALAELLGKNAAQTIVALGYKLGLIKPL